MTPLDRAALAAALKDATPETLREDAALLLDIARDLEAYVRDSGPEPFPPAARRLAALALAVAMLEERNAKNAATHGLVSAWVAQLEGGDGVDVRAEYSSVQSVPLAAALAALLKGDQ